MAEYTRDSLEAKLAEQAPKVQDFLKGRTPTEGLIKSYYDGIGDRVSSNAVKKMFKHLTATKS